MKKKMTILAVLVAAVAITSYSVAGTYAKYTSTSTASDTARVAKWGIGVTNKIENLFANSYILDEQDNDIEAKEAVIAPGASGHYSFQFTGENAPEVAYKLKATVNITDPTGKLKFFIEKADYNKETFSDDLGSFKAESEFESSLETFFSKEVYKPGDQTALNKNYTLYWIWDFDGNDTTDTYLGNGKDTSNGDNDYTTGSPVTVEVTVTAEQANDYKAA